LFPPCSMLLSLLAFASCLVLVVPVRAQISAPNCTDPTLAWSFNSLQQSPCQVTAYLAAVCDNGAFLIPPLLPQNSYAGPSGNDDNDLCKCNTVVYNLISACDACQGSPWTPYSTWTSNCTKKANPGTFPEPVPAGTRVPQWAYIDTSISNNWNIALAQAVGDTPEVTGTASIVPPSTSGVSQSTLTPSASGSTSASHRSSDAGAIAGGFIGAIAGVALIAGVVVWFIKRRRRVRSAPSTAYLSLQGGEIEHRQPVPYYPQSIEMPRLYDPSDPMTYPRNVYTPVNNTHLSSSLSSTSHRQSTNGGYHGLPEI